MDNRTVVVEGLPSTCNALKLKLRFQLDCDVKIASMKIESDQTHVIFENPEDADKFCAKIPKSVNFGGKNYDITGKKMVVKKNDHEAAINHAKDEPDFNKAYTWYDLTKIPKYKKGLLVQYEKQLSWTELKSYFQNNLISRGGPIAEGINMVDGLLLFFEIESTVDDVWNSRPHRIGPVKVTVHVKHVPSPNNRHMIIEAKDDYSEQNAKRDLESCCPGDTIVTLDKVKRCQSSNILVQYSKKSEEKSLQDIMENYQKSIGRSIKLLLETDCIMVDKLPNGVSDVEIVTLFENASRTGGGIVTFVHKLNETSALVYFASFYDAQNAFDKVCKKGLDLFGHSLKISLYFHCLQQRHLTIAGDVQQIDVPMSATVTVESQQKQVGDPQAEPTIPSLVAVAPKERQDEACRWTFIYSDINTDLMKFFAEKPEHLKRLENILHPASVRIHIQSGLFVEGPCPKIVIAMPITADMCKIKIEKFLKDYVCEKLDEFDANTIIKVRKESVDFRFEAIYTGSEDVIVRWTGENKCEIVCVGQKVSVEALVDDMKKTIEHKGCRVVLEEWKFRWLEYFKIMEKTPSKNAVKIETDSEKQEVVFSGAASECARARHWVCGMIKNIVYAEYQPKTISTKKFLMKASTNAENVLWLNGQINKDGSQVIFTAKGNDLFFYGLTSDIPTAQSRMCEIVTEESFSIAELNQNDSFKKRLRSLEEKGNIQIIAQDNGAAIVGFKSSVEDVKNVLKPSRQTGITETQFTTSAAKAEYLLVKHNEYKSVVKKHPVTAQKTEQGLLLSGEASNVMEVFSKLHNWTSALVESQEHVMEHGIVKFIHSEEGIDMLRTTGTKHNTVILASIGQGSNQDQMHTSANSASKRKYSTPNESSDVQIHSMTVCVKQGDITEERCDAIVNSTLHGFNLRSGSLSSAVLKKAGEVIQKEVTKSNGKHLRVTSGGKLPCKHIFHAVQPNNIGDLRKRITSILDQAGRLECNILSFPVILLTDSNSSISNADIAKEMIRAIDDYAVTKRAHPKRICIIIHEHFRLSDFRHALSRYRGWHQSQKAAARALPPRENSKSFGDIKVTIRRGDITQERNDAIVNSSGPTFDLNYGLVSKAIIKEGGHAIQHDVDKKPGDSIRVSIAGRLPCRHIIHIVAPEYKGDIPSCLHAILKTAEECKFKSISIPALGTGQRKMDPFDIGKLFSQAFSTYSSICSNHYYLRIVDIVIFASDHFSPFCAGFAMEEAESPSIESTMKNAFKRILGFGRFVSKNPEGNSLNEIPTSNVGKETNIDAESVTLKFCSEDRWSIDQASQSVKQHIKAEFKTEKFVEKRLLSLTPEDMSQIMTIGERNDVAVTTSGSTVTVSGRRDQADHAMNEIRKFINRYQWNPTQNSTYPHNL